MLDYGNISHKNLLQTSSKTKFQRSSLIETVMADKHGKLDKLIKRPKVKIPNNNKILIYKQKFTKIIK